MIPLTTRLQHLFGLLPSRVKVGSRYVGEGCPTFVIAEIGNNHNGDFDLALRTIQSAKEAGADAVKFQRRTVDQVFTKEMREMPYPGPRSLAPTYGEHRQKLEFNREQMIALKNFAEEQGLIFFVTPFDATSADFLEDIGVHAYKIASFDVTNLPLLQHIAKKGKPMLLSTGLSTLEEIDRAVEAILEHNNRLIVNHCTSIYPTPDENVDLHVVSLLKKRYAPLPIGYSGHEPDILASVVSVGMGATTVERHFTLDKTMNGSDHHMSIEPQEFKQMVDDIRRSEVMLGSKEKRIHEAEKPIRAKHAKSVATTRAIKKGEPLTKDALTLKSPGSGISPLQLPSLVGRVAARDLPEDALVPEEALTW